ncbi:hypothetical protein VPH35_072623 [Triticum aestivum]|uniref:uncharacterized protein isoform X1 n=1 Tax=Triticum aestivum TaxID=4565 RepID=UPI001D027626|nr:uncharacterized protein LOC123094714 isoform X1 [Triticum aestivum]
MNPSSLHFPLWRRSPPNRAAFESSHGCAVDVGADTGLPSPIQQVQETRTFTLFVYDKSREQGRPHAAAIVDPHRRPSLLPRRRPAAACAPVHSKSHHVLPDPMTATDVAVIDYVDDDPPSRLSNQMVDPWSQMPPPMDATTWRPPMTRSS